MDTVKKIAVVLALVSGTSASANGLYSCRIDAYMESSWLNDFETNLSYEPTSGSFMLAIEDSRLRFNTLSEFAPAAFFRDVEVPVIRKVPRSNLGTQGFVYTGKREGFAFEIQIDTSERPVVLLYSSLLHGQLISLTARCTK